jgi:5-methylcytosine-specific restriction endonuclease McrA
MVLKKATIPKALKEQVWIKWCGERFSNKCTVVWCTNKITVFDWEAGHNIPESKGGGTTLDNLQPICGRCNKSMGNKYSIDEWNKLGGLPNHERKTLIKKESEGQTAVKKRWFCCFG